MPLPVKKSISCSPQNPPTYFNWFQVFTSKWWPDLWIFLSCFTGESNIINIEKKNLNDALFVWIIVVFYQLFGLSFWQCELQTLYNFLNVGYSSGHCEVLSVNVVNSLYNIQNLKLQSLTLTYLSPSLFENLELQLLAELSSLRGLWVGTASAWINLMFWGECVAVRYVLYFAITDSSLFLGIYDTNKTFHRILSSEQVSNKSATFVLTNWGKKHYHNKRATNGDLI